MPWYGYALIATFAGAVVGLLQKKTLQREHTVEYITIITVMKFGLFALVFGRYLELGVSLWQFSWLAISGIAGSLGFFLIAKAIRHLEISTVLPVLSFEPALTVLFAFLVLGEAITRAQLFGIVLMILGAYALELHRRPHDDRPTGHRRFLLPFREIASQPAGRFALWALLLFGLSSVLDRFILLQVKPTTYMFYTLAVMTVVYLTVFIVQRRRLDIFHHGNRMMVFLILGVAVFHLISLLSQATAVSLAAVGLVVAVKRLSILIDVFVGGRLFREHHLKQKLVATAIMLAGVYWIVRP